MDDSAAFAGLDGQRKRCGGIAGIDSIMGQLCDRVRVPGCVVVDVRCAVILMCMQAVWVLSCLMRV